MNKSRLFIVIISTALLIANIVMGILTVWNGRSCWLNVIGALTMVCVLIVMDINYRKEKKDNRKKKKKNRK